jgi:hypothetical protein
VRESIADDELRNVAISLRTFSGESADQLLARQATAQGDLCFGILNRFKSKHYLGRSHIL